MAKELTKTFMTEHGAKKKSSKLNWIDYIRYLRTQEGKK
jgi:hypothetical protein